MERKSYAAAAACIPLSYDFGYITVASYMDFVTSTVCSDPTSTSVAIMYSSKTLNNKLVLAIYFICMVDS